MSLSSAPSMLDMSFPYSAWNSFELGWVSLALRLKTVAHCCRKMASILVGMAVGWSVLFAKGATSPRRGMLRVGAAWSGGIGRTARGEGIGALIGMGSRCSR